MKERRRHVQETPALGTPVGQCHRFQRSTCSQAGIVGQLKATRARPGRRLLGKVKQPELPLAAGTLFHKVTSPRGTWAWGRGGERIQGGKHMEGGGGYREGGLAGGAKGGGGRIRADYQVCHPWRSQNTNCLTHTATCNPMLCSESEKLANTNATKSSISSQHLKGSTVPKTQGAYCVLCARAMHKICRGPYPSCIVVPSTLPLYELLACFALISSVLVCVVLHPFL